MEKTTPLNLKIILGSTRPSRFSELAAHWVTSLAQKDASFHVDVLDLRDYPMPYFEEPTSPSGIALGADYGKEVVNKWARKIEEGDAFLFVAPEYNHG